MKNTNPSWYRLNPVLSGLLISTLMVLSFRYYYLQAINPPLNLSTIEWLSFSTIAGQETDLQQRSLPDDWLDSSPGLQQGWYRATINRETVPVGLWAIYLPVVQMNAKIYFNHSLIGQIDEFNTRKSNLDPFVRAISRPYYFTLPENLLQAGKNNLEIQVWSAPGSGLLGKIYIGEDHLLNPIYKNRYALLVTSIPIITSAMLAIAILMSVLWLLRKQDSVYGWYALTLYTWVGHNIFSTGLDIPLSQQAQNSLSLVALGWFILFMVKATHSYMGQQFPAREKIMLGSVLTGSVMIIFSTHLPWSTLVTHQIWSTFVLNLAAYALLDFIVKYREREDLQNPIIIPAGVSMLIFGVHDWLMLMHLVSREDGRLLHFAAPVAVSVFGALLLERFAKTLKRAESLNLELERRVAEKHAELEVNYQRLKEIEHKQLLADERERFMKEIHDGVGGHLVSMLSMVRSGKQQTNLLVDAIETTLDDLRIMIDSLTPREQDIPALLGAMRHRIEPQLQTSGLKLHWQVDELPAVRDFGPHKALQVMRIVQEAITNVIRHAQAQHIFIKAFVETRNMGDVIIEIVDDGYGILRAEKRGRGLGNMHQRAADIGARLDIVNSNPGTTIRLTLQSH